MWPWVMLICIQGAASLTSLLDGYNVTWEVSGDDIKFELVAPTTGWIGFGISGGAGMKGADIVRVDGSGAIEDGYSMAKEPPKKDCQQDWTLESRMVEDGYTTVVIQRKLDTGDTQDRPLINDGQSTLLLLSYGSPGENEFGYHFMRRTTLRVNLFGPSPSIDELVADADVKSFAITAGNYSIPYPGNMDAVTSYMNICADVPEDGHAVAFEPLLTKGHEIAIVHHMVLFTSNMPCQSWMASGEGIQSIIVTATLPNMWLYGPGTGPFLFPADISLPIGDTVKSFYINMHYDNPESKTDLVDDSGIRIYYKTSKRKHDLGVLFVGDPRIAYMGRPVPVYGPGSIESSLSKYTFTCPRSWFYDVLPEGANIKLLGSSLHMHFSGEYMKTELLNLMGGVKASWEVDVYDGAFQAHKDIPGHPTFRKGDYFRTTCAYNNKKLHGKDRVWGFSAEDEMCMDWIYFYSDDNEITSNIQKKDLGSCGYGADGSHSDKEFVEDAQTLITFGQPAQGCTSQSGGSKRKRKSSKKNKKSKKTKKSSPRTKKKTKKGKTANKKR